MARRTTPAARRSIPATMAASVSPVSIEQVSGNAVMAASAAIFKHNRTPNAQTDRHTIAKRWQIEAYRHVHICGEARYAVTLFSAIAGRAEIGVSEPHTLRDQPSWVNQGPEVDALAELCPTVRERTRLIRDYMTHRTIAGECYLIARRRVDTDPGFVSPPDDPTTGKPYDTWEAYLAEHAETVDVLDPDYDPEDETGDPNIDNPLWEIVAVTEIQKTGDGTWKVRHDNGHYLELAKSDPVIRLWNPDPEDRREAWSPFRSLLPTLIEIEWLTKHIFTQVRSRLMSAGVWFLPENLTFAPPPASAVEGGEEAMATMNEAQLFMASLAASSMSLLDDDEVSFPTVIMADPLALEAIDQQKLIKFWSEIDDKAMILRDGAIKRFASGMDMPAGKVIDPITVAKSSESSGGGQNHWGKWAEQEQIISDHIEPALDDFVGALTVGFLRLAVPGTKMVLAYGTDSLRMRQDRSKEAMEWYDRGVLKAEVALRRTGFDPATDMMTKDEHKIWMLNQMLKGSPAPEQMQAAFLILSGQELPLKELPRDGQVPDGPEPKGIAGPNQPPSLEDHPYEGPPRVQHDQTEAPFSARAASAEALVLRAMEKYGNRLLNDGKRGRDKDRSTPPHLAHLTASIERTVSSTEFDFSTAGYLLDGLPAADQSRLITQLSKFTAALYNEGVAYSREALLNTVKGL